MQSALRLAFIVIGGCVYAGLAVAGWGGFRPFFSHAALTALVAVLFALLILSFFAGGRLNAGVREDRGNRQVLPVFGILGLLNAYLPAYTDREGLWTLDGNAIRWLGVVLFALGGVLRVWLVFVLGNRFSGLLAIQPEHTLVTRGVRSDPAPKLPWATDQLTRMESGFSFDGWCAAHTFANAAAISAYPGRRKSVGIEFGSTALRHHV